MTLLERDRETNLLINGLQQTLLKTLGLETPRSPQLDRGGGGVDGRLESSDV